MLVKIQMFEVYDSLTVELSIHLATKSLEKLGNPLNFLNLCFSIYRITCSLHFDEWKLARLRKLRPEANLKVHLPSLADNSIASEAGQGRFSWCPERDLHSLPPEPPVHNPPMFLGLQESPNGGTLHATR